MEDIDERPPTCEKCNTPFVWCMCEARTDAINDIKKICNEYLESVHARPEDIPYDRTLQKFYTILLLCDQADITLDTGKE